MRRLDLRFESSIRTCPHPNPPPLAGEGTGGGGVLSFHRIFGGVLDGRVHSGAHA